MPDEQAYIVFDGSNKPMSWPAELHGFPTRIFKQTRSGGWEAFLKALEVPRQVKGVMISAPPQSLSIMVSGLKAHFPQTFLDLMKVTLVLLTEDDEATQVDPLKRLYGFRSLILSSWTEEHLMEFVGNIFQPPLEQLPEAPKLAGEMAATQMADYYSLIGLQKTATQKEINAALNYYREYWSERARNPETRPKAEYSLALIAQAETLLLEPAKRERYDAVLETVRAQPRGKGPRGTRRLEAPATGGSGSLAGGDADDSVYTPTAWTRDGGITRAGKGEEVRNATRAAQDRAREKDKDGGVYRPPAWTRDERDADYERRAAPQPAEAPEDGTVYRPPGWKRGDEREDSEFEDASREGVGLLEEAGSEGTEALLEELARAEAESTLLAETPGLAEAPEQEKPPVDPNDPEAMLAAELADPELDIKNLPGLGRRREDPGGDPWPPRDWPPKDWVPRESMLGEDVSAKVPIEEDHAPLVQDSPTPSLEDAEAGPAEELAEAPRPNLRFDSSILHKVAPAGLDLEIWASAVMALDAKAAFPSEAGMLLGTRFEVGDRLYYIVTGTYSLGGDPPGERIGYYVRTKPGNVAEAQQALEEAVGPPTTVDLSLAVDLSTGFGRFFKTGASRRPFAASPVVRLSSWQQAPPSGDRMIDFVRRNKWTMLAASGIVFLGTFTWSLYQSLGGAPSDGPPELQVMEVSSYIRADGVVLKWKQSMDKVSVYRVDAADSTAHWRLVEHISDRRLGTVDPEPVERPGRYRYLILGSSDEPRRTAVSKIQALDVR
jgi:curved DNA-binding protein CbpA